MHTFKLTMPVSVNAKLQLQYGRRRAMNSSRYRTWLDEAVQDICNNADASEGALTTAVRVGVIVIPPDNRRRDVDNFLKGINDALTRSGLIADDSLIERQGVHRRAADKATGGVAWVFVWSSEESYDMEEVLNGSYLNQA